MPDVFSISNSIKVISFVGSDIDQFSQSDREYWSRVIDDLGVNSAKAQHLSRPITTFDKLRRIAKYHRVYIAMKAIDSGYKPIGLLKIGAKRIFHLNKESDNVEHLTCLCLLDFYVSEDCCRSGNGKTMMDAMVASEPHINSVQDLAIDRPSKPCLSFFEKYYKLHPTRVGIDGNFCIFSDAALSQVSHFPSPTDLAKDYKATSIFYDKI